MKAALHHSESHGPAALVIVDRGRRIRSISQAAEELLRLESGRALDALTSEALPNLAGAFSSAIDQGDRFTSYEFDHADRQLMAEILPLRLNGSIEGALAVLRRAPVTTPDEATGELTRQLEAIIDASFDGIWVCDSQGKTLKINRAAARYSGVKPEEVVGQHMRDLVEQGLFDRAATLEVLEKRAPVTIIQDTRAGYRLLTTGTPIFDQAGRLALVFTNERDISELSRMQRQIEESYRLWSKRGHVTFDEEGLAFLERHNIIARSEEMYRVLEACQRAAKFDISVLLSGESGAGKGVLAKFIHTISGRADKPFIRINCGSIPETLMEAELFGYERGAFTGARTEGKKGLIEAADQGTLFLDEVGELPLALQVKLLAFLDDREVTRIGATRAQRFDVRIIAATNRDLAQLVAQRQFREELWFRLNVIPIDIPALRQRPADIPPLIHHFLGVCNRKFATTTTIHPDAVDALCRYSFPGNARELRNIVERLVVTKGSEQITRADLQSVLERAPQQPRPPASNLKEAKETVERQMLIEVLAKYGSQAKAAAALGLDQSSISRKIKKYKLMEHYIVHQP